MPEGSNVSKMIIEVINAAHTPEFEKRMKVNRHIEYRNKHNVSKRNCSVYLNDLAMNQFQSVSRIFVMMFNNKSASHDIRDCITQTYHTFIANGWLDTAGEPTQKALDNAHSDFIKPDELRFADVRADIHPAPHIDGREKEGL